MRILFPIAAAVLVAGCAARAPQPAASPTPAPAPAKRELHTNLSGATAGELMQLLGQPALQVREGSGLKLQFRGRECILDAYLYPTSQGERVTYIDARTSSGGAIDKEECVLSMVRR